MRDVILLEPVEGGVRLQALFEEPVTVQAMVRRIDFLKHGSPWCVCRRSRMVVMTDLDKLRALLPHWIEHNAEHAAEFQHAGRRRAVGRRLHGAGGRGDRHWLPMSWAGSMRT